MKKHYSESKLMAFVDNALHETEYNLITPHMKPCGQPVVIQEETVYER